MKSLRGPFLIERSPTMNSRNLAPAEIKTPQSCTIATSECVQRAIDHYQNKQAAKRFVSASVGTATDRREKKCVAKALNLADVPRGKSVLDIPCGAGRMLPLLKKWGYTVTGADVSANMVEEARRYAGAQGQNCLDDKDDIVVANVFNTGFVNKQFDAVMCHRLFQYFNEPADRRLALAELRRISKGPIIISFSCNWSIDAIGYKIRRFLGITRERSCKPISPTTLSEDVRACGLEVERWIAMRPFISKRWYAVIRPATVSGTFADKIIAYRNILSAALGRLAVCTALVLIGFFALNHAASIAESQIAQIIKDNQDGNNNFYVSADPHLRNLHIREKFSVIADAASIHSNITEDQSHLKDSYFLVSDGDLEKIRNTAASEHLLFVKLVEVGAEEFTLLTTETKHLR
jgi:SAM-dependent methyltransferase